MLHVELPEAPPTELPQADALSDAPNACVKACYRCVLSYFNQPDHDLVDRTDAGARRVLLRLAGIETELEAPEVGASPNPTASSSAAESPWVIRWRGEMAVNGVTLPAWTLAGESAPQWPAAYAAVVLPDTPTDLKERLEQEGATLFPFRADVTRWPELFQRLAKYLKGALS